MHVHSVSETEGGAESDWKQSVRPCRYCKVQGQRYSRFWESNDGAYTDEKNECLACGKAWWVEGVDPWLAGGRFSLPGQATPDCSHRSFLARPFAAVVSACMIIGFSALREMARRIGH